MDAVSEKELGIEAGEAARATTRAIADAQGASREKALKVIGKAMDAGLRKKNPDLKNGLRGADMALKIHDAYPSEKVDHNVNIVNPMSIAVQVFHAHKSAEASSSSASPPSPGADVPGDLPESE